MEETEFCLLSHCDKQISLTLSQDLARNIFENIPITVTQLFTQLQSLQQRIILVPTSPWRIKEEC